MGKRLVNHCHKQNTIGCDENIDFTDTEEHMKTVIIGIAGGTGSGKSTFTNRLKDEFKDQVAVLYHDNYYRAQDDILLSGKLNDAPSGRLFRADLEFLQRCPSL